MILYLFVNLPPQAKRKRLLALTRRAAPQMRRFQNAPRTFPKYSQTLPRVFAQASRLIQDSRRQPRTHRLLPCAPVLLQTQKHARLRNVSGAYPAQKRARAKRLRAKQKTIFFSRKYFKRPPAIPLPPATPEPVALRHERSANPLRDIPCRSVCRPQKSLANRREKWKPP